MNASLPRPLSAVDDGQGGESTDLLTLFRCGLPVAPTVFVPASAESEFYRLNNLAPTLAAAFSRLDPDFPDDELIEDLAPAAQATLRGHYLLQEFVDAFFEQVSSLPGPLLLRRPGEGGGPTAVGAQGALLALKGSWAEQWSFERLWSRVAGGGPLLPAFAPVLVQPESHERLPVELSREAGALLGREVEVLGSPRLGICRLVYLV